MYFQIKIKDKVPVNCRSYLAALKYLVCWSNQLKKTYRAMVFEANKKRLDSSVLVIINSYTFSFHPKHIIGKGVQANDENFEKLIKVVRKLRTDIELDIKDLNNHLMVNKVPKIPQFSLPSIELKIVAEPED